MKFDLMKYFAYCLENQLNDEEQASVTSYIESLEKKVTKEISLNGLFTLEELTEKFDNIIVIRNKFNDDGVATSEAYAGDFNKEQVIINALELLNKTLYNNEYKIKMDPVKLITLELAIEIILKEMF